MASRSRILLIAGSDSDSGWVEAVLRDGGQPEPQIVRVDDELRCRTALREGTWDAVIVAGEPRPPAYEAVRQADLELPPLILLTETFDEVSGLAHRLGAAVCLRSGGAAHLGPALERAAAERRRRAERERWAAFEDGQRDILEQIASGAPLTTVLVRIVLLVERQAEGMLCSVLLLDGETGRMRHGAAPSLPEEFARAIDGAPIGPRAGSCGTAAYRRERVVVEDIGTHPFWADYRQLALPWGLRACWSSPIFAEERGDVLGTFAMYYREARGPTEEETRWVDRATHLAAIAISRDRAERAARQADARYRQIVDTAYEGVWLVDADARTLFVNQRTTELFGFSADEMLGKRLPDFMDEPSRQQAEGDLLHRLRTISEQHEFRFLRKDGSSFWAILAGSPIRDDERQIVGALGMITDITELKSAEEALRQSEAEFRVVFENAAIGMALLDLEGRAVRSNPALQRLLGYGDAELRERRFADLADPADAGRDAQLFRDLSGGARDSYQSEGRFLRRGGEVAWGRLSASLVRGAGGEPLYVIVMIEDVTDRRRMEEAVRSSERLRSLMYGAVSDVLFYVGVEPDERFRFLSVNPAFLRATGLPEEHVVGRLVSEVIPEPSCGQVLAHYRRAIAERRTFSWDEVSVYPAGTKYGEVSITPIFGDDGACTNLIGTVHDVTERHLAEERLAAQAALLDKAKDAILVHDLDGVVSYWSQGAERLYGIPREQAVGRRVTELLFQDPGQFEASRSALLKDGELTAEMVQLTGARTPVTLECSWTLLRDEEGRPKSVLAIHTDITAIRALESRIHRSQQLASLGTMAGGIAHDFNNILTAVLTNARLALQVLPGGHPAQEAVSEVERAGERASDLVRQILTFSRQEAPKRQVVDVRPVVEEAARLLQAMLPPNIRLETRIGADVPALSADPTQVHQIVVNLGTNAAHAMEARAAGGSAGAATKAAGAAGIAADAAAGMRTPGGVEIAADAAGAGGLLGLSLERATLDAPLATASDELPAGVYARLTVSDTGCGMDAATLEHIFEPFFTTRPQGRGTGLGLAVVHGIVKSHGGGIAVRSRPGLGTELAVYLPAAKTAPRASGTFRIAPDHAWRGRGERVLCLDDEEPIVRAVTRMLDALGYRTAGFTGARAALQAFASAADPFDAVVTDMTMPEMSGPAFVHELRRLRPGLAVVMMSGSLTPEEARHAHELGVSELVIKPSIADIGPALHRLLGQSGS